MKNVVYILIVCFVFCLNGYCGGTSGRISAIKKQPNVHHVYSLENFYSLYYTFIVQTTDGNIWLYELDTWTKKYNKVLIFKPIPTHEK